MQEENQHVVADFASCEFGAWWGSGVDPILIIFQIPNQQRSSARKIWHFVEQARAVSTYRSASKMANSINLLCRFLRCETEHHVRLGVFGILVPGGIAIVWRHVARMKLTDRMSPREERMVLQAQR